MVTQNKLRMHKKIRSFRRRRKKYTICDFKANALNRSINTDSSWRAHIFLSYHLIQVPSCSEEIAPRGRWSSEPSTPTFPMVFILDGCSFIHAHIRSKSGLSICRRNLVTSKESSNPNFFSRKRPFLHYTCATSSELPSYISTIICTIVLYEVL